MKSKITTFIMTILTIILIILVTIIGLMIYNEIAKTNIADEVQDFVSNITTSSGGTNQNEIQTPEILQTTIETISPSDKKIDYSNSTINKYFYSQLDNYSKIIYNALEKNKENMKTGTYEMNLGTEFTKVLSENNGEKTLGDYYQTAVEAYTYDNPEIFYIDFQKLYLNIETTTRGEEKTYKVIINSGNNSNYLVDGFTKEKIDDSLNEIDKIKTYFIQNKQQNEYQNIKNVHDYLVETIDYDETISQQNIYDIYGALINKKCVCEGYAKAFKYLMEAIDVPCVIVAGEGTNSDGNTENHAWNYVQLNGIWYAIDCTWDDPILMNGAVLTNSAKYKYFLKGANNFYQTHTPNGQFTEGGKMFTFPQLNTQNY